jgi:hypothetical protein
MRKTSVGPGAIGAEVDFRHFLGVPSDADSNLVFANRRLKSMHFSLIMYKRLKFLKTCVKLCKKWA